MKFRQFCNIYSSDRIRRYLIASNNNSKKAMRLYYQNQLLAKAFHPLLGMYEVALRNNLNKALSNYFNDRDWIINQQNGFMHDNAIKYRRGRVDHFYLLEEVQKEISKLNQNHIPISSSKIISELNFGFWAMLFKPNHSTLLNDVPLQVFSSNPDKTWTSQQYYTMVNEIREFRNRVSHNESLIFSSNAIDLSKAKKVHKLIIDSSNWIDPRIYSDFCKSDLDKVQEAIYIIEHGNEPRRKRLCHWINQILHLFLKLVQQKHRELN